MIEIYKDKRHRRWCNNCHKPLDFDQGVKIWHDTGGTCIALCNDCMQLMINKLQKFLYDQNAGDCMSLFENIDEYRKSLLEGKEQEIKRLEKELEGKDTSNLDLKLTAYVVEDDVCAR